MLLFVVSLISFLSSTAAQNSTSCIQSWQSRGPNNIDPVDPISPIGIGAVSSTFIPNNSTTLFLGSVNGGVWKTTNFQASPAPHYIPTTDTNSCNSVGTLAGSLSDPNFIAYGCDGVSNFAGVSGPFNGVYVSTNGGTNWTHTNLPYGFGNAGQYINKIIVSGTSSGSSVITVSTRGQKVSDVNVYYYGTGAIYTSTNLGATWTSYSTAGSGNVRPFDMIQDPFTLTTLYYVDDSKRVFKNTASGVGSWTVLTNTSFMTTECAGLTSDGAAVDTVLNAKLAIHATATNNVLYVGYYGYSSTNGALCYAFYFSTNQGVTWTTMLAPNGRTMYNVSGSGTANGPGYADLGTQGVPNFIMLADPTDPRYLYVGGTVTEIFRGDRTYTGSSLNESNGALWSFLRDIYVNGFIVPKYTLTGTGPHADIRYFDWDNLQNHLICTNDGGIWIHTNPRGIGDWIHKNGDLVITEFMSVAYNSATDTIVSGAQDNSVWVSNSTASQVASGTSTQGMFYGFPVGDGEGVAIDSAQSPPVLYGTGQELGFFFKASLSQQAPASYTVFSYTYQSTNFDFFTILAINAVNSRYLLVCTDQRMIQLGQSDYCNRYDMTTGSYQVLPTATPLFSGYALNYYKYGGYHNGAADQSMVFGIDFVNGIIYASDTATGVHVHSFTSMSRGNIVNIISMNPNNYYQSYVVDAKSTVWQTLDFGATWTDVTGTLYNDTGSHEMPYSWGSVVIPMSTYNALAVGTSYGVYVAFDTQMGSNTRWHKLGLSIPNVLTSSLVYDPTRDLLVAATTGRGWWTLSQVSAQLTYWMTGSCPLNLTTVTSTTSTTTTTSKTTTTSTTTTSTATSTTTSTARTSTTQTTVTTTSATTSTTTTATTTTVTTATTTTVTTATTTTVTTVTTVTVITTINTATATTTAGSDSTKSIIIGVTTGVGSLILVAIISICIWYFCCRQPASKIQPKKKPQAPRSERL